jgi:hypothetical protein
MLRLSILYIVAAIYLYLIIVVMINVWYVKIATRYKWAIFIATVLFAPAGYWWYRWAKKKYGSRKKKGPKK